MTHPFLTTEYTRKAEIIVKIQFKPGRPWVTVREKFKNEDALDLWIKEKGLPCNA